jgi:hypothetical protein
MYMRVLYKTDTLSKVIFDSLNRKKETGDVRQSKAASPF